LDEIGQAGGIRFGQKVFELPGFHDPDAVRPAFDQFLQVFLEDFMPRISAVQIRTPLVRQRPPRVNSS